MASETSETALTAACLCGASTFSLPIPTSQLPLDADFCHCTSCRHGTGALFFGAADYPGPLPANAATTLARYAFSPSVDVYFCPTCGTWMFWNHREMGYVGVACGVLDQPERQVELLKHMFLGDTRDGGAGEWIGHVAGVELKRFKERAGGETLPVGWKADGGGADEEPREEKLHLHCLCKGVEFYVTRPDEESRDLSLGEPGEEKCWWINSVGLYTAQPCACTSCRLAAGVDIFPWAYIPLANLVLADGKPLRLDDCGKLKSYNSSPGRTRYFCEGCGATAFFASDGRPKLVDVAVGLMDAGSGVRAEEWVAWSGIQDAVYNTAAEEWLAWRTPVLGWDGDGLNRTLMEAAKEGLAAYGERLREAGA